MYSLSLLENTPSPKPMTVEEIESSLSLIDGFMREQKNRHIKDIYKLWGMEKLEQLRAGILRLGSKCILDIIAFIDRSSGKSYAFLCYLAADTEKSRFKILKQQKRYTKLRMGFDFKVLFEGKHAEDLKTLFQFISKEKRAPLLKILKNNFPNILFGLNEPLLPLNDVRHFCMLNKKRIVESIDLTVPKETPLPTIKLIDNRQNAIINTLPVNTIPTMPPTQPLLGQSLFNKPMPPFIPAYIPPRIMPAPIMMSTFLPPFIPLAQDIPLETSAAMSNQLDNQTIIPDEMPQGSPNRLERPITLLEEQALLNIQGSNLQKKPATMTETEKDLAEETLYFTKKKANPQKTKKIQKKDRPTNATFNFQEATPEDLALSKFIHHLQNTPEKRNKNDKYIRLIFEKCIYSKNVDAIIAFLISIQNCIKKDGLSSLIKLLSTKASKETHSRIFSVLITEPTSLNSIVTNIMHIKNNRLDTYIPLPCDPVMLDLVVTKLNMIQEILKIDYDHPIMDRLNLHKKNYNLTNAYMPRTKKPSLLINNHENFLPTPQFAPIAMPIQQYTATEEKSPEFDDFIKILKTIKPITNYLNQLFTLTANCFSKPELIARYFERVQNYIVQNGFASLEKVINAIASSKINVFRVLQLLAVNNDYVILVVKAAFKDYGRQPYAHATYNHAMLKMIVDNFNTVVNNITALTYKTLVKILEENNFKLPPHTTYFVINDKPNNKRKQPSFNKKNTPKKKKQCVANAETQTPETTFVQEEQQMVIEKPRENDGNDTEYDNFQDDASLTINQSDLCSQIDELFDLTQFSEYMMDSEILPVATSTQPAASLALNAFGFFSQSSSHFNQQNPPIGFDDDLNAFNPFNDQPLYNDENLFEF